MSRAHLSGELAERVTHEIGNHLQVVLGNAELLSLAATLSDDSRRRLAWITEAGRGAAAVNGTLRELSRHDCGHPEGAAEAQPSLGEALTRTRPALEWLVSPAHLKTTVGTDVGTVRLSAAAPPDLLCELLLRLARETCVASGETVTLRARLLGTRPNALLRLGIGIDAPDGARTSASPRQDADASGDEGNALSLDILAALAELAGGRLDAGGSTRSPPDLLLPVARGAIDS